MITIKQKSYLNFIQCKTRCSFSISFLLVVLVLAHVLELELVLVLVLELELAVMQLIALIVLDTH